ncbi:MAG: SBBP repeat-containing protein [Flavobacteriales bacterium]
MLLLTLMGGPGKAQTCALDVFVANDQSGSVSALENLQSRQFISALFNAMQPWGTGPGESRMAIADWDSPGVWLQYNFPVAGPNYTTLLADVLAYQTAPRILSGGTDPYTALLRSFQGIDQTPVPGRTAAPVIVLMTDAHCSQVPAGIGALADQIKSAGVYIIVVAIEMAAGCPALAGTNVASPGGYFSAATYAELVGSSVSLVQGMVNAGCAGAPSPSYDLVPAIDSFTASGCNAPPASFVANLTITNEGAAPFSGPLLVSFYNGPPSSGTAQLLYVHSFGAQTLAPGASFSGTVSSLLLGGTNMLYAVVNYDGAASGNAPPIPYSLWGHTVVADEYSTLNNTTGPVSRVDDPVTCPPQAIITASIVSGGTGCDDQVAYTVTICNTGDAPAFITPTLPIAVPGALLVNNAVLPGNSAAELDWATYDGGDDIDEAFSLATDAAGNVYVAGTTRSNAGIATAGSHQPSLNNGRDAFLVKFAPNGTRLWGTYYGDDGDDFGTSVAVDGNGNVYLAGYTDSPAGMATAGAFQPALSDGEDAFLVKFNSNGVRQWATYYGGLQPDFGYSAATDGAGNVYLAGVSEGSINLATAGSHDNTFNGISDPFLVKFNATGVRQWATYYGGAALEDEAQVATDAAGNVYLAGTTKSPAGIATAGAAQAAWGGNGNPDAFLVKFNGLGVRQWGTYCGGMETEEFVSVAADASGNLFLSGTTNSDNNIAFLPQHQGTRAGSRDGFLVKYNQAGARQWGTYFGGGNTERARDVAADAAGNVYVTGSTSSANLIATAGSYATSLNGPQDDAFLMRFNPNGTRTWGTYYGGTGLEDGYTVAADPFGSVYIAGATPSLTGIATPGAHQTALHTPLDAFLAKFFGVELPFQLAQGECITRQYLYDYSAVAPGTYSLSMGIDAQAVNMGDDTPLVLPDIGFNAGGYIGISGFNGALHTSDDAVIPVAGTACGSGDLLTVAVNIPPAVSCGTGHYATATVTITNNSGLNLSSTDLYLNLIGAGSVFAGEIHGASAGLSITGPNLLDPAYPSVPFALYGDFGAQSIPILNIPPGISSFQVDLAFGTALTNLQVRIDSIHTGVNPSGHSNLASDGTGVTVVPYPTITGFNCPGSITAGSSVVLTGISVSGATAIGWSSGTVASITGGGSLAAPTLNYTPTPMDVANGFAEITLNAVNASGCETTVSCQVDITNVQYDYGDAPVVYDLNINYQPPAAASTILTGIHLGLAAPGTEPLAHNSMMADGDGSEEDALAANPWTDPWPPVGSSYALPTRATNTSAFATYLHAYIDWNADGDFLDTLESSHNTVTIPPASGSAVHGMQFTVPPTVNTGSLFYIRVRLSVDSMSVTVPYMAAPRGETEDYVWASVGPLPVELLSFSGRCDGHEVLLEWSTASESGSSHFVVERSVDAVRYDSIGTVPAAGYSHALLEYSLSDPRAAAGVDYYLLRQVDLDGGVRMYGPVAVRCGSSGRPWLQELSVGRFQVLGLPDDAEVLMTDALGRRIGLRPDASGVFDATGLAPGAYLMLLHGPGLREVLRFVKR